MTTAVGVESAGLRRGGDAMTVPAAAARATGAPPRRRARPTVYVWLSVLLASIAVVGFWPTFFGPALRGRFPNPTVVEIHALIFVGWLMLLLAQVVLAARGRLEAHRRVGRWGIAYGFLIVAMGLIVAVAAALLHTRAGDFSLDEAAQFLAIPFPDVALFAGFFVAAVLHRGRPEIHKRLMLVATVALVSPAVARMTFLGNQILLLLLIGWLPLIVGMLYDWRVRGRPHAVYVVGLAALIVIGFGLRFLMVSSETWLGIARAILDAASVR
jgi:hypothetical protein